MPTLLSLPTELRLQILHHLFTSCLPTPDSPLPPIHSQFSRTSLSPNSSPPPSNWLQKIRLYIDHERVTASPIAGGKHLIPRDENTIGRKAGCEGVFTVCKVLREEALDVWYEFVGFEFKENSRRAEWFEKKAVWNRRISRVLRREKVFGRAEAVALLGKKGRELEGEQRCFLRRVRNCEVFLDVEDEEEMKKTPGRLRLLMESLDMERMKYFRVAVRFTYTSFETHSRSRHFGERRWWSAVRKDAVAERTWRKFLEEIEALQLKRFCGKGDGRGWEGGDSHVVWVADEWHYGEGGEERDEGNCHYARWETLAGVMGAVIETEEEGRLVNGEPERPRDRW